MHRRRKSPLLGVLAVLLAWGHVGQAINLQLTDAESIKAAASAAAYGMMKYYKGNETGMIPGLLVAPYYWWEAGAMFGQLIEYWYYTGDATYNSLVTEGLLFQTGPNNDYMPPNQTKNEGNDDQAFWAFAAMSAAELNFPDPGPGAPSWLSLAQAVFNLQTTRWDMSRCNGGLRWQIFPFNNGYEYKNTISTGSFFQLAARLARYTGNQTYAEWAEKSWDWMQASPLISPTYEIFDGTVMANNCSDASRILWTYNVGTLLAGASFMYNHTDADPKWEQRIDGLMNGTNVFFVGPAGANNPPANPPGDGSVMSEVACEFPAKQTCNYDQPSFKAYLSRWMAVTTQMAPFTAPIIIPRLQGSAIAAAGQCTGQPGGNTCGRRWYQSVWDGQAGVGEQMSAMSIFQANLIGLVKPPVTAESGGTSKGDPSAGSGGDADTAVGGSLTKKVSTGDKAGAGVLTFLALAVLIGSTYWIIF